MQTALKKSVIVLLGVGHTHAHIVRMWKMHPIPDAELVCISDRPVATYSGMLPGVLAGQYPPEQMQIDLVRLCGSASCRLVVDQVESVDRERRQVIFKDRAPIRYDILSIGIGSRPSTERVQFDPDAPVELIKPMQTFLQRLTSRLQALKAKSARPIRAVVVGGGVGGIEIGLCLLTRLQKLFPNVDCQVSLVTGGELGGGTAPPTRRKLRAALAARNVSLIEKQIVSRVGQDELQLESGKQLPADLVLWATGAVAPELLSRVDVQKDERGFLAIRPTLQTVSDDTIFAVGDTATLIEQPSAKAGVYAVRQGPILWRNMQRWLTREPLETYTPQKNFLKLINTGDGKAVGEYWHQASHSHLMWRIKDRIDVRFMRRYQDYRGMTPLIEPPQMGDTKRCLGCGGKVSSASLRAALAELESNEAPHVALGLDAPDDAAIIHCPDQQVTATVDFFAAPFDDPYLMGRIAAVHAASDCFAMGASPTTALAMVQIPYGHPRGQQRVLRELLAGAHDEFRRLGAAIVGGHTIEGPSTMMGFTVLARQITKPLLKSGLRPGNRLILTKPLGTGVLLAGLMRNRCRGTWYVELVEQMRKGNEINLDLAQRYSIQAMTDVTGFGLAGHLLEMLDASQVRATIELARVPVLAGSLELIEEGLESTLAPDNRAAESRLGISAASWDRARLQVLFDPQTCGGMLIGVNPRDEEGILAELHRGGFSQAASIGTVLESSPLAGSRSSIEIV